MTDDTINRRISDAWRKGINTDVEELKRSVAENTKITRAIEEKLDGHITKTASVVTAYDNLQVGIKVLDGIGRAGMWLFDKWKPILAVGIAFKVITGGGGWAEVRMAVMKFMRID